LPGPFLSIGKLLNLLKETEGHMENLSEDQQSLSGYTITIAEYNLEIDEAIARVKGGDYFTQEEVERMAADW